MVDEPCDEPGRRDGQQRREVRASSASRSLGEAGQRRGLNDRPLSGLRKGHGKRRRRGAALVSDNHPREDDSRGKRRPHDEGDREHSQNSAQYRPSHDRFTLAWVSVTPP